MSRERRRHASAVLALCAVVSLGALTPVPLASATTEPPVAPDLQTMDEFDPADYVDEAAALPEELVAALDRDVELTAEEYLAQADAAHRSITVVESLEDAGVDVLGSSLDGSTLVVNVATAADARLVREAGARPAFGEPEAFDLGDREATLAADVYDGQGYFWNDGPRNYQCTVGFNGFSSAGAPEFVTAGHCLEGVAPIQGFVRTLNQTQPGQAIVPANHGSAIGSEVPGTQRFAEVAPIADDEYDTVRVATNASGIVAKPTIVTWGYGGGAPFSSPRYSVSGEAPAVLGAIACRAGSRSGWACGEIVDVDWYQTFDGGAFGINSIVVQMCAIPGDSGGPLISGAFALGVTSWTTNSTGCTSDTYSGYFPMVSPGGYASIREAYGATWELAVTVPTPRVTSWTGTGVNPTAISGTLANATAPNTVQISIDGGAPVEVDASTGSWTLSLASVPAGFHTFSVVGQYGDYSVSAPVTGSFTKGVTVTRLTGTDRFGTGIQVAQAGYPSGGNVLFLTTGLNYPDALSAGPAATHLGGPLMLVQPGGISDQVAQAIEDFTAFGPTRVFVLGAENSVSATAYNQIVAAVSSGSTVERLTGTDRFDTSRVIARMAFLETPAPYDGGSTSLFVSNGLNFPDALSAGGAAATVDAPVLMVPGTASSVPAATTQLIADLGVTNIYVTGAENSVSAGIYNQLAALPGITTIQRITGTDRYGTSAGINAQFFSPTETLAVMATGQNYPDALAGSGFAGSQGAPLYIAQQSCIPPLVFADLVRLKVTSLTLLGGTPSLATTVATMQRC